MFNYLVECDYCYHPVVVSFLLEPETPVTIDDYICEECLNVRYIASPL